MAHPASRPAAVLLRNLIGWRTSISPICVAWGPRYPGPVAAAPHKHMHQPPLDAISGSPSRGLASSDQPVAEEGTTAMHVGEISPVTRSLWFQRASMNQACAFARCSPRVHGCCGTIIALLDTSHVRIDYRSSCGPVHYKWLTVLTCC